MQGLQYVRSVPRWLTVRALSSRFPSIATGPLSCLRLATLPAPELPGPDWVRIRPRLSGICGSDLATISCRGSTYFSAVTDLPVVLGHEIVGDIVEAGSDVDHHREGDRVIVEPALGCTARGIAETCPACADGNQGNCINVAGGRLAAGLQTGYCRDTGGGWSGSVVAHQSQLHGLDDSLDDEDAVMIEPFACSVHAVLRARVDAGSTVLIMGAGTVGLLTLHALKKHAPECRVWIAAKYPHQAELARQLGADDVLGTGGELRDVVIARTGARRYEPDLGKTMVLGGVDTTFDCVGASRTIDEAIRLTRARGTVVVVGMPSYLNGIEGTALWYKETRVIGAYTYGLERIGAKAERTFAIARRTATENPGVLAKLITNRFPLSAHRKALAVAFRTGPHKAIKTVFDLRQE